MIRFAWVALVTALATLVLGLLVIIASLLRVRGRIYTWATQQWSRIILWASGTPVTVHGMERVDWSQPQILVCNHISGYDVYALAGVLPAPFAFVAKKELGWIPLFGTAWKAAGHISVDRSNREKAMESLRRAGERIRREPSTVIIFPEGTRSRTGELQPFKKGAFMLALEAGFPVVPAVVRGSDLIQKPGSWRIRPHPIHLYFDTPIRPDANTVESIEAYMDAVRSRMLAMMRAAEEPPEARPR